MWITHKTTVDTSPLAFILRNKTLTFKASLDLLSAMPKKEKYSPQSVSQALTFYWRPLLGIICSPAFAVFFWNIKCVAHSWVQGVMSCTSSEASWSRFSSELVRECPYFKKTLKEQISAAEPALTSEPCLNHRGGGFCTKIFSYKCGSDKQLLHGWHIKTTTKAHNTTAKIKTAKCHRASPTTFPQLKVQHKSILNKSAKTSKWLRNDNN